MRFWKRGEHSNCSISRGKIRGGFEELSRKPEEKRKQRSCIQIGLNTVFRPEIPNATSVKEFVVASAPAAGLDEALSRGTADPFS